MVRRSVDFPSVRVSYNARRRRALPRLVFGLGRVPFLGHFVPRGHSPKTWIEYVWEDLVHLSDLHGVFGVYMHR
jgi:hypothetical protein